MEFSIDNLVLFANCQPVVPPDPWTLAWDLEVVNNTAQSVTIALAGAQLAFGDPLNPSFETSFSAESPSTLEVGAGMIESFSFMKTGFVSAPPCNECNRAVQLTAQYSVDGGPDDEPVESNTTAQCVF